MTGHNTSYQRQRMEANTAKKKPEKKTDFTEYSFDGSPLLNVPDNFNTHMQEITYIEGSV